MTGSLPFVNVHRMIADGIPYSDYVQAMEEIGPDKSWFDWWDERASTYESAGNRALEQGHHVTAGEWLWLASLSAHYGQYMWFDEPEKREAGQRRKSQLYDHAAPYLSPAGERIEVPLDGTVIPGYLRLPSSQTDAPLPVVVLIGGLESTKEESLLFENLCLDRRMATFAFDGPGQGEMFFDLPLRSDFERYTSAVIDALVERPDLDSERIAVLGRSLGGYYAVRSAAGDDRIRACVAWGVMYDMDEYDQMPDHTKHACAYVSHLADDTARGREYVREALNLADVIAEVRCPVYAQHGARDILFSMQHVERLQRGLVNAELTLDIEPEGSHCCHNMPTLTRPRMADWLAQQLGTTKFAAARATSESAP